MKSLLCVRILYPKLGTFFSNDSLLFLSLGIPLTIVSVPWYPPRPVRHVHGRHPRGRGRVPEGHQAGT